MLKIPREVVPYQSRLTYSPFLFSTLSNEESVKPFSPLRCLVLSVILKLPLFGFLPELWKIDLALIPPIVLWCSLKNKSKENPVVDTPSVLESSAVAWPETPLCRCKWHCCHPQQVEGALESTVCSYFSCFPSGRLLRAGTPNRGSNLPQALRTAIELAS